MKTGVRRIIFDDNLRERNPLGALIRRLESLVEVKRKVGSIGIEYNATILAPKLIPSAPESKKERLNTTVQED